jgi:type III restriction enzyme
VAILQDGSHHLVETKGREDPDVAHKDRAAALWCGNATELTHKPWVYLKVPQKGFDDLQPTSFSDLFLFHGIKL